jgi:hypothetical protein
VPSETIETRLLSSLSNAIVLLPRVTRSNRPFVPVAAYHAPAPAGASPHT